MDEYELIRKRDQLLEEAEAQAADLRAQLDVVIKKIQQLRTVPDDPIEFQKLCEVVHKRFKWWPTFERFSGGSCRVWCQDKWHYRDGACSGELRGQGFSPLDALRCFVAKADSYEHVAEGSQWTCADCKARDIDY